MRRRECRRGFTLVELLVVIGIIAILMSILIPALNKARQSANIVKCAANLRSIGQGLTSYVTDNKQTFPAAYLYAGMKIENGVQTPDAAVNGYVHWSNYIYKRGAPDDPQAYLSASSWQAFQCPSIDNGGLPPTNTVPANRDAGQVNDNGESVVDFQAPRCAFTVNEAIMPRNKFVLGFQGASRSYQFVRAAQVKRPAETILATEWNQDWHIVADRGRSNPEEVVCKSHRPVHGFTSMLGSPFIEQLAPDPFGGRAGFRRATVDDLAGDPQPGGSARTTLDWVGRNHGRKVVKNGIDQRMTNFLYVDGHVETKHITQTVDKKFEWGERFYSLVQTSDFVEQ